jgi:capsid protein
MEFPAVIQRMFGYDATVSGGKRKRPATEKRSEDLILNERKRDLLASATRDLQRNFALVAWAVRKHLDYVSMFDFQMRTGEDALNIDIERRMSEWMRPQNCDATGRHPFQRLLRIIESRRTIDGDVFAVKQRSGKLQVVEADRVRNPERQPGQMDWYNGIKVDTAGRTLAYAIHDRTPHGFVFARDVAAGRMIHHGYFERIDQVRGVSPLAAAVNSFRDVYEGVDYALAKMKVEQLFALVFYRDANESIGEVSGQSGSYNVDFGKGPVQLDLDPGDQANFLKSDNPGSNTQEFLKAVISIALKSLDLPLNFYDESHTNFFGSRAAWLLYDRSCIAKRADVQEFLRKVTVWKLRQWVVEDGLRLPAGMTLNDLPFEWVPRGMPWWDPKKEIEGSLAAMRAGLDNPYRITKETGRGEFEENIDQIARAQQYAAERGVSLDFAMSQQPMMEASDDE